MFCPFIPMTYSSNCPPNYKNGYELMIHVCEKFGHKKPNCFVIVSISNEPHICFLKCELSETEQKELVNYFGCYWSAKYTAICISQETLLKYE